MAIDVVSFGCRLNAYESEVMRKAAAEAGLGGLAGGAVVVNTCAVTGEAVRQARQAIRKARRDHPAARIIVTGCAAQTDPDAFAAMDEVDLVLGNEEKLDPRHYRALPDFGVNALEKVRVNDIMSVRETAGHMVDALDTAVETLAPGLSDEPAWPTLRAHLLLLVIRTWGWKEAQVEHSPCELFHKGFFRPEVCPGL